MTATKHTTLRERNQHANTTPMLLLLSFRMRLPIWLLIILLVRCLTAMMSCYKKEDAGLLHKVD